MRARPSLTAELVCLLRASSGLDPYAEHFLSRPARAGLAAMRMARERGLRFDPATRGMEAAIRARHLYIDEALLESVEAGYTQIVLLGAGYDARPWRFAEALDDCRVFVVDHPATLARREELGADLPPTGARAVPVDFALEDFAASLRAAGFDPARRTFFAWEGVSMYLTREVNLATLERIAALGGPETRVALDLWRPHEGRDAWGALEKLATWAVAQVGEPLVFGLHSGQVHTFFHEAGYDVLETLPMAELGMRYGLPEVYRGLRVVLAEAL